jgi:hypothetical protein
MIIFWPIAIVVYAIIFMVEIVLLIQQWMLYIVLGIHDFLWSIHWFIVSLFQGLVDLFFYILFYIPNLIAYYWGLLMTLIFKPFDDICIWWFSIFDGIADVILSIVNVPTWSPAFGIEMILSLPIQAVNLINIDAVGL